MVALVSFEGGRLYLLYLEADLREDHGVPITAFIVVMRPI